MRMGGVRGYFKYKHEMLRQLIYYNIMINVIHHFSVQQLVLSVELSITRGEVDSDRNPLCLWHVSQFYHELNELVNNCTKNP